MLRPRVLPAAAVLLSVLSSWHAAAQSASDYYEQNCAPCHSIGQGSSNGGPDLKDVTRRRDREWLIRFLLDPEAFASDPAVMKMIDEAGGMQMPPPEGMTKDLAEALLELIDERSATAAEPAAPAAAAPFTTDEIGHGADLFAGRRRFSSSKPACVYCHDTGSLPPPGGGRLGPDLTQVRARLGGGPALAGWLRTMPTPVMRAAFGAGALTAEESRALAAFLDAAGAVAPAAADSRQRRVLVGAMEVAGLALAAIALFGAGRLRGVRRRLVSRRANGAAKSGGSR